MRDDTKNGCVADYWSPSSCVACLAGVKRVREGGDKGGGVLERGKHTSSFSLLLFLFSISHFAPAAQANLSLVGSSVVCYTAVFSIVTQRFVLRGVFA